MLTTIVMERRGHKHVIALHVTLTICEEMNFKEQCVAAS